MKFTIDTDNKVIEVNDAISIVDLIDELKKLLGKEWKEYSLQQVARYYPYYPQYPIIYGNWPIEEPYKITCSDNTEAWVHLTEN